MLERYLEYAEALKANGNALTFTAPCCGESIQTQAAVNDETWTTLACCPYCKTLYRKIVTKTLAKAVLLAEETCDEHE